MRVGDQPCRSGGSRVPLLPLPRRPGGVGGGVAARGGHEAQGGVGGGGRRGAGPGRGGAEANRGRCRRRAARAPGDAAVRAACASATSPVGAAEAACLCSLSREGRGGLGRGVLGGSNRGHPSRQSVWCVAYDDDLFPPPHEARNAMSTHATSPAAGWSWLKQAVHLGRRNPRAVFGAVRSEEHTSELQPLMRISYAVFCL